MRNPGSTTQIIKELSFGKTMRDTMDKMQSGRLAKIYLPLSFVAITLISTIVHHLSTPLPPNRSWAEMAALDVLVLLLIAPLLYHCLRTMGTTQGLLFFFTVSIFMGGLEALWVFLGKLGILAIAEGSNLVRIGTAIFGPRLYNVKN